MSTAELLERGPLQTGFENQIAKEVWAATLAHAMQTSKTQIARALPKSIYTGRVLSTVFEGPRSGVSGIHLDKKTKEDPQFTAQRPNLIMRETARSIAKRCPWLITLQSGSDSENSQAPIDWIRVSGDQPLQLMTTIEQTAIEEAYKRVVESTILNNTLETYLATFGNGNYPLPVCQEEMPRIADNSLTDLNDITLEDWVIGLLKAKKRAGLKMIDRTEYRKEILIALFQSTTGVISKKQCYELAAQQSYGCPYLELSDTEKHSLRVAVSNALRSLTKRFSWLKLMERSRSHGNKVVRIIDAIQITDRPEISNQTLDRAIKMAYGNACSRLDGRAPGGRNFGRFIDTHNAENFPIHVKIAD